MSGLDIYDHFEITGDGITLAWDFGVPVRQVAGIKCATKDEPGVSMDLERWKQLARGVAIEPALAEREVVTAYYYRA